MIEPDDTCDNPAHRFLSRDRRQAVRDAKFWRSQAEQAAARVSALELDKRWQDMNDRFNVQWLQGKVLRQTRELKRMAEAEEMRRLRQEDPTAPFERL